MAISKHNVVAVLVKVPNGDQVVAEVWCVLSFIKGDLDELIPIMNPLDNFPNPSYKELPAISHFGDGMYSVKSLRLTKKYLLTTESA